MIFRIRIQLHRKQCRLSHPVILSLISSVFHQIVPRGVDNGPYSFGTFDKAEFQAVTLTVQTDPSVVKMLSVMMTSG